VEHPVGTYAGMLTGTGHLTDQFRERAYIKHYSTQVIAMQESFRRLEKTVRLTDYSTCQLHALKPSVLAAQKVEWDPRTA
jgi:hypothetical protein